MNTESPRLPVWVARFLAEDKSLAQSKNIRWIVLERSFGRTRRIAAVAHKEQALPHCTGDRHLYDVRQQCLVPVPKGCGSLIRLPQENNALVRCGNPHHGAKLICAHCAA
jgi:hypothetical protein